MKIQKIIRCRSRSLKYAECHFTLLFCRGRLRKIILTNVQSNCSARSLNLLFRDVLVLRGGLLEPLIRRALAEIEGFRYRQFLYIGNSYSSSSQTKTKMGTVMHAMDQEKTSKKSLLINN